MKKLTERDVLEAVQKSLGDEGAQVTLKSKATDVKGWDSLGHLGILAALDQEFDGKVAQIEEMGNVDSMPMIIQILKKHALI